MLKNEIILKDFEVKMLLELFNKGFDSEDEMDEEHIKLKDKLKDCLYGY